MDGQGKKPAWVPAVKIFSDISTFIVVPIVVALVVGKWLDGKFDTEPTIFLSLAGFGFLVTIFGIVRVVKEYGNNLKKTAKDGDNQ